MFWGLIIILTKWYDFSEYEMILLSYILFL